MILTPVKTQDSLLQAKGRNSISDWKELLWSFVHLTTTNTLN